MKRYVWQIEVKGNEASWVPTKREEEMRAQRRRKTVKMQGWRVWKRRISTYANILRCLAHTYTHTWAQVCSFAVALSWIPPISGCHTGQGWLLEQQLPVALWGYYMVYQSSTNNMDRISHFPLPPQIITYHRRRGISPPPHSRDLSQP